MGLLLGFFTYGAPLGAVLPFSVARPSEPVLDWTPWRNRKGKIPRPKGALKCIATRFGIWVFLLFSVPEPVYASPFPRSVWVLLPTAARAMARPPQEDDPPGQAFATRRPHLPPTHDLVTHVGVCHDVLVQEPLDPFEGCETNVLALTSPHLRHVTHGPTSEQDWLGIHLYTPHYQPLQLAIRPQEKTLESVLALLVTYDQDPDGCLFDTVVPIRPQSYHGSGSFLRFSSSIKGVGTGGMVAIIMDLTAVGGPFFSTVLPQGIAFQTLRDYFGPLTTIGDEPVDVFVGCCDRPLSSDSQANLSDGDVVLVLRRNSGRPSQQTASSLFEHGAVWAPPANCHRLTARTSVCVLHKDKRYCIPDCQPQAHSLVQQVSEILNLNPYCMVTCTFPITDLEVQGQACPFVMAVAEVPSPEVTGMNRDDARDVFVLLDPRPMGQKPCFLFLHHPVVHLPSVAAMLGLSTGRTRRLGVRGGDRRGDDVFVEGCTALVLFAEETDDASVDSASTDRSDGLATDMSLGIGVESVAGPPGLPLQAVVYNDPSSPVGDVWGGGPQLTMEGVDILDPTLPEGQSWNAGRPAARGRDTIEDYGFEELVAGPEPAILCLQGMLKSRCLCGFQFLSMSRILCQKS